MPLRRQFLFGLASLTLSAPALVRLYPLMSVSPIAPLGPPTTSFGFAQRLYVDACIRWMAPFRNAGLSHVEIAKSLNAGGLVTINREAWDSSGVGRIIALDRALAKSRPARGAPCGMLAGQSTEIAAAVAIKRECKA